MYPPCVDSASQLAFVGHLGWGRFVWGEAEGSAPSQPPPLHRDTSLPPPPPPRQRPSHSDQHVAEDGSRFSDSLLGGALPSNSVVSLAPTSPLSSLAEGVTEIGGVVRS